jgi:hypothetical protein
MEAVDDGAAEGTAEGGGETAVGVAVETAGAGEGTLHAMEAPLTNRSEKRTRHIITAGMTGTFTLFCMKTTSSLDLRSNRRF